MQSDMLVTGLHQSVHVCGIYKTSRILAAVQHQCKAFGEAFHSPFGHLLYVDMELMYSATVLHPATRPDSFDTFVEGIYNVRSADRVVGT